MRSRSLPALMMTCGRRYFGARWRCWPALRRSPAVRSPIGCRGTTAALDRKLVNSVLSQEGADAVTHDPKTGRSRLGAPAEVVIGMTKRREVVVDGRSPRCFFDAVHDALTRDRTSGVTKLKAAPQVQSLAYGRIEE